MTQPAREKYTKLAIWLHWIIGIAILVQLALGLFMVDLPRGTPERSYYFNLHKSLGVTIALFVLLRLWWRATHTPPTLQGIIPDWQVAASKLSHWVLYLCLILMPVSGFIASSYSKFGIKVWGLFEIASWGEDKELREVWIEVHEVTMYVLVAVLVIHVLAALKHLLVDKDGVFQRMTP